MDRYVIRKKRGPSPVDEETMNKKHSDAFQLENKDGVRSNWINKEEAKERREIDHKDEKKPTPSVIDETEYHSSKSLYKGIDLSFENLKSSSSLTWRKIKRNNLDLDYAILFPRRLADSLFRVLEEELQYFTGDLARIQVFGKWHNIPRKQGTYGDPGLTYRYSGTVTPARPWPRPLEAIRDLLVRVTGHAFNFVLVNRYNDGNDKMGEHKDDERELDPATPIASVSLGQPRDFYFKHQDARGPKKMNIDKVNMVLENGSLLLMNSPTNKYWYHALPPRKSAPGVRINLTFRKIVMK